MQPRQGKKEMNEVPSTQPAPPNLGDMPAEEFRQYGHQLIDWIADFLAKVGNLPVFPNVQPGDIAGKLPNAAPIKGEGMDQILDDVERVIMPGRSPWRQTATGDRNINASHVKLNSATICLPSDWAVEIRVLFRQRASIFEIVSK